MLNLIKLPPTARIVDLGGTEYLWRLFGHDFHVVLVNLPGRNQPVSNTSRFSLVEADACDMADIFHDASFDLAFSNSVIEHVGDEQHQCRFAAEVRRIGRAYWVQTPSDCFPIEAHTGIPYYWRLPGWICERLRRNWKRKLPDWSRMIDETRVLSRRRMMELFPDGKLYIECKFGFEKSYSAYRPFV